MKIKDGKILGSVYVGVSEEFQRGVYPIARCLKAETHDLAVVMKYADVKIIGQMDNTKDHTFESANRVYNTKGVAPAMVTCGGVGCNQRSLRRNKSWLCVEERGRNLLQWSKL